MDHSTCWITMATWVYHIQVCYLPILLFTSNVHYVSPYVYPWYTMCVSYPYAYVYHHMLIPTLGISCMYPDYMHTSHTHTLGFSYVKHNYYKLTWLFITNMHGVCHHKPFTLILYKRCAIPSQTGDFSSAYGLTITHFTIKNINVTSTVLQSNITNFKIVL